MTKNKDFKLFLESIVDIERINYSSDVFDEHDTTEPKLKSSVKQQILAGVNQLNKIAKVKSYYLVGSILTKNYNSTADIDVSVVFDVPENLQDEKYASLFNKITEINGSMIPGTKHPINYYLIMNAEREEYAYHRADNIYDIEGDKFSKRQVKEKQESIDVHLYLDKFKKQINSIDLLKTKFQRDLIDYKEYRELPANSIRGLHEITNKHLKVLEDDINTLVDREEDILTKRRAAFAKDLTKEELRKYGSHNRLPQNILYKILEKYHYLDFIHHLKDVIGQDRKLTHSEAEQL